MKTCKRCNTEKPLDAFYVHSQMADGHLNICKECVKARVAIYDKQPHVRERDRNRRRGGRDQKHVARMRAYRKNNSQRIKEYKAGYFREQRKRKANYAISNGLRDGKIIRPNKCEKCGKQCQPQAHHPNYDEPLNVQWLCSKCHGQAHWKQVSASPLTAGTLKMESKIEIAGMQKIDGQKMRFPRGARERLMQFFVEAPTGYYTLRVSKARKSKSELSPFPPPCARGAFPLLMSRAYFS